jgi:gas vesicle protein GvpL/GvpF
LCALQIVCFLHMTRTSGRNDDWQVYALAAGPLPARIRVGARSVRILRVGSIAVMAGVPHERSLEEALRDQHSIVVELARRFDPILPVRFGARMTAARIAQVIRPSAHVLAKALSHVQGRRQMTMRLIGPAAPVPPPATGGADYLARRLAAHTFPQEAASLRDALSRFVVDQRIQPGRGGIRVTAFHLVNRNDIEAYIEAAKDASEGIAPLRMSLTGPWPPFAFAPELSQ